jgi:hypothetical protein
LHQRLRFVVAGPPTIHGAGIRIDDPVLRDALLLIHRPFLQPIGAPRTRRQDFDRQYEPSDVLEPRSPFPGVSREYKDVGLQLTSL